VARNLLTRSRASDVAPVTDAVALPIPLAQAPVKVVEAGPSRRRRLGRMARGKARVWIPAVLGIALACVAWEIGAVLNPYLLPRGYLVFESLFSDPLFYLQNAAMTLEVTLVGFTSSFLIAFVLAVIMAHIKFVERMLMPLVVILKVTPGIAIAPALVIAFGFGTLPKYVVTGLMVFFQLLVSTLIGLRSADPQAMDIAKTLKASKLEILFRLRLPYSLPFIFSAVKVCLPVSVIGAVVAEFSTAGFQRGLGSAIQMAATLSNLPQVYACILCLAVIGLVMSWLVARAESRLLSWHPAGGRM